MFIKLYQESDSYIVKIFNGDTSYPNDYNYSIVSSDITKTEFDDLNRDKYDIKLGITSSGFDTNLVSKSFKQQMELRSNGHPALWELYHSENGMIYRLHMSSIEMRSMIHEYEEDQTLRKWLIENDFYEINQTDSLLDKLKLTKDNVSNIIL